ncbi:MAG: serine/threonine-protein phosphatase, partial [Alphaproteobacteria bacterium]|nr:serine/threonine-protein phosphatase [Alphaproteobacteria bacterium]
PQYTGMGTTVAVLLVEGGQAHVAHVGDSRIYLWRDGHLSRLTRDHTVVQQEIDAGRLTPEMARKVRHRRDIYPVFRELFARPDARAAHGGSA